MDTPCLGEVKGAAPARRRRAVVVGDHDGPYHPIGAIAPLLEHHLGVDFDLKFVSSAQPLAEVLSGAALLVSYADRWKGVPLSGENSRAVCAYVSGGGGLLVLHNGVCWAHDEGLLPVIGARFVGHPDQEELRYGLCPLHPITEGLQGFQVREEPYRYEFAAGFPQHPLLHYTQAEQSWPAGWCHPYGAGRVVVLQPGHHAPSFMDQAYGALLQRSARWCSGIS